MEVHHHSHSHENKNWKTYFWESSSCYFSRCFVVSWRRISANTRVEQQREKQFMATMLDDVNSDTA